MTDAVATRLGEARRALEQALTQNQHERVLALCDQLLEAPADQLSLGDNVDDRDLLRARLYQARSTAGAHLAQTETALSDVEQIPERLRDEQVCFLQAYLLYRTRRLKDALQLISASLSTESGDVMTDEARRWGLLRAQVAYAQGDLAQAAKVWRQLIVHGPDSNETAAIWSNWIAALSSRLDSKADNDDWGEAIAAIQNARIFEGFFNLSIWHTSQRKYESAMRWLDEARALAIAELGTDRHHDVARIDVQRACLFQLQDQDQRAQALYRDLGTWRGTRALVPVDGSADWVRAFNASVLEGDLAALLDSDPSSWTLTECQRQLLLWNRAIAALSSNKAQIALATVEEMTFDPLDRIVLKACALDARGRHQEAEQILLEHRLSMHAAQMRLQRGDVGGALALLEQSPGPSLQSKSNDLPVRNQPACVLFRATWYRRQGYLDKAIQTLIEAASDALPIRRLYAELLLESKQFGSVLDSIPNDADTDPVLQLYRLIALSYLDPDAAERRLPKHFEAGIAAAAAAAVLGPHSEQLLGTESDPGTKQRPLPNQDAKEKRQQQAADDPNRMQTDRIDQESSIAKRQSRRRGHRRRRNPLPPSYRADASPPDPSRWLPRSQRPGFRRRQRRPAGSGANASTVAGTTDRATQGKIEASKELDTHGRTPAAAAALPPATGAAMKLAGKRRVRPSRSKRA